MPQRPREAARVTHYTDRVLTAVATATGITKTEIRSRSRKQGLVRCRQVCWWVLCELGTSYSAVGREFGCDHATVRAGVLKFRSSLHSREWWALELQDKVLEVAGHQENRSPPIEERAVEDTTDLRIVNDALVQRIAAVERERDRHFSLRRDIAARHDAIRAKLQAIREAALKSHDYSEYEMAIYNILEILET